MFLMNIRWVVSLLIRDFCLFRIRRVRVPPYLLERARALHSEEKKTLDEIKALLVFEGNSELIANAIITKLDEETP